MASFLVSPPPALLDPLLDPLVYLSLDPAGRASAQRDRPGEAPLIQLHLDRAPRQARGDQHLQQPEKAHLPARFLFDHTFHRSVILALNGESRYSSGPWVPSHSDMNARTRSVVASLGERHLLVSLLTGCSDLAAEMRHDRR